MWIYVNTCGYMGIHVDIWGCMGYMGIYIYICIYNIYIYMCVCGIYIAHYLDLCIYGNSRAERYTG